MIDKTAIIEKGANIAENVSVGAYSVIGKDVTIGENTIVGPHVVIQGRTSIGKNNKIFQFASVGADPQHKQYAGEDTSLEIGDNNVIREYCSIHRGTKQGHGYTKIGDNNFLMSYVHIAHDCILSNNITFANNATLAGHVNVGNNVVLGGFAVVLQFCSLGDYCFVAGETGVLKDVLPYVLVSGYHEQVKTYGLNLIGLKRNGFSKETLQHLKNAYRIIFRQDLTVKQALPKLEAMLTKCPEVAGMIEMLKKSKRGIVR
ncbi:MAG: acyl-ACP--UDP-N-acetylglucosamine O-acyltransferase [Gammaproteobacteria bacterium]